MYKDILVPVEISDEPAWKKPLAAGIEFAQRFGARLHIMTVVPSLNVMVGGYFPEDFEQKAHEHADQELHQFVAQHVPKDLQVQTIVAAGKIYEQIIKTADELGCDLIIMGRSGEEQGPVFLLGTNASRVARHATTSVLIAH